MRHSLLLLLLMTGCAQVCVEQEYALVGEEVVCRTGHTLCCEEAELRRPLTEDGAISIALAHNPVLQARLASIGIAKSNLVQAGLLTNPFLSIDWRLPYGRNCIESSLLFAFTDLWQLPLRKRVARLEQQAVQARVIADVLHTAAEARRAYFERQFAIAKLDLMQELMENAIKLRETTEYRQGFGYSTDLDIAMSLSMQGMQRSMLLGAEQMAMMSNMELRLALGIGDSCPPMTVRDPLTSRLRALPDNDALVQLALQSNPEIRAFEWEVERAEESVSLAKSRVFREVGLGLAHEKSPGETNGFGPAIGMQLPIFDQNQAEIARTQFELSRSCHELQAEKLRISTRVREAATQYRTAQRQLDVYRKEILPALQRGFEYTTTYSGRYQINMLMLLESFRSLREARLAEQELLLTLNQTLATLEELVGQRLYS
jgi:outer membrane protein, heavy metal efflux system